MQRIKTPRGGRIHFRAGHSLNYFYENGWATVPRETTWTLDGLIVSYNEGAYLRENRPCERTRAAGPGYCALVGLKITEAEAMRIRHYEDPYLVLRAKYWLEAVPWKPEGNDAAD